MCNGFNDPMRVTTSHANNTILDNLREIAQNLS